MNKVSRIFIKGTGNINGIHTYTLAYIHTSIQKDTLLQNQYIYSFKTQELEKRKVARSTAQNFPPSAQYSTLPVVISFVLHCSTFPA